MRALLSLLLVLAAGQAQSVEQGDEIAGVRVGAAFNPEGYQLRDDGKYQKAAKLGTVMGGLEVATCGARIHSISWYKQYLRPTTEGQGLSHTFPAALVVSENPVDDSVALASSLEAAMKSLGWSGGEWNQDEDLGGEEGESLWQILSKGESMRHLSVWCTARWGCRVSVDLRSGAECVEGL